ncbi:hypothetical protein MRX96_033587 [Rhipicephalus microplus]
MLRASALSSNELYANSAWRSRHRSCGEQPRRREIKTSSSFRRAPKGTSGRERSADAAASDAAINLRTRQTVSKPPSRQLVCFGFCQVSAAWSAVSLTTGITNTVHHSKRFDR